MPIIQAEINGREYSFAPLLMKEVRALHAPPAIGASAITHIDWMMPFIRGSMVRAGSEPIDLEELDVETASRTFQAMVSAMMRASGLEPPTA